MKMNVKRLAVNAMSMALVMSLSSFMIPIGAFKCFPTQYLANVVVDVFLDPGCGVVMTFCASSICNLVGTGSLLTFPGSMVGTLIYGLACRYSGRLMLAHAREVSGTGIVGGVLYYPVVTMATGKEAAMFVYMTPFLMSTLCGTVTTALLVGILCKSGAFKYMKYLPDINIRPFKVVGK